MSIPDSPALSRDTLLRPREVYAHFGITARRLRTSRALCGGIPFVRFGTGRNARVYYRVGDILDYVAAHMCRVGVAVE